MMSAKGGADYLIGGDSTAKGTVQNVLIGDGGLLTGKAEGGADMVFGGNARKGSVVNVLIGDACSLEWSGLAGEDILVAGIASGGSANVQNYMWGDVVFADENTDGAADRFIFGNGAGTFNFIMDFQLGLDTIEFDFGCHSGNQDIATRLENGNTIIDAGITSVTLVGFSGFLTEDSFLFV
jgi:hypothetical protein